LIEELLSAEEIALWHGLPRAGKSLLLLRACVDLALGDSPVWDEPRFQVARPIRTLYFTEEDGAGLLVERLTTLLAGRAIPRTLKEADENLRIVSRKGLSFDRPDAQGQAAIFSAISSWRAEVVAFDPLRSLTAHCDQGPSELSPVTQFLRKLLRETPCRAIIIGHHDVKPPREGGDTRARAHRASGGGIFSIADSPINFERPDDTSPIFCFPSLFKGRVATPAPFQVTLVQGAGGALGFRVSAAGEASPIDARILKFVGENPGCIARALRDGITGDTGRVTARTAFLVQRGDIIQVPGVGRRLLHYLRDQVPKDIHTEVPTTQEPNPV
jgi:hypothetical protein